MSLRLWCAVPFAATVLASCAEVELSPVRDLKVQLEAIRASRAGNPAPLTVRVKSGVYPVTETIRLTAADSGLSFVAEEDGRAVFSGGRTLGTFRDTGKGWWEVETSGLADIQQLSVNGRFAVPATSPNEGYFYVKDAPGGARDAFTADAADVAPLKTLSAADLARVRVPLYQSWDMGVSVLTNFDAAANALAVSPGCTRPILFWNKFRPRFKLQNLRAALDAPGEWFQEGDKVLYVPRAGETPESSVAVAAVTEKLLDVEGATNVVFRGLAFEQARLQIGGRGFTNQQAQYSLPAAVEARETSGLVFDRCRFSRLAPQALRLGKGTADARVTHCLFEDLGAGGVYIGTTDYDKKNLRAYANRILVRDNIIREGGRLADGSHGVWLGHTADVTVEHNEIADFHYTGIASGWRWGYAPTPTRRIRIAWNHVHHIGNGILSDMAAIYTLGEHEGSEIVGNHIHDVWCYGQAGRGGRGIYTDEGSAHILIASNLVHDISSGQITQHYGKDNRFINNIFAFSRGTGEMIYHAKIEKHHSFDFDHNIIVWEGAREAVHSWDGYTAERALTDVTFDNNLWWRYDGDAAADEFNHVDYATWRKLGADPHGLIADPKFVDGPGLDFDLAADSPARALGFVPWDWRSSGVTGEPAWRKLAEKKYYDPPKVPAAPLYVPQGQERQIAATLHVAGHEFPIRDRELPLAKKIGITTVRGGIYLQQVKTPTGWDFSRADAALASCERAGIEWLPILIQPHAKPAAHENLPLWREYVRQMATRYRGRVKTWEVWNEQNIEGFWPQPDPTNYVKVLQAAYGEIKAADPAAQVAVGGYAGVPFDYIEAVYKAGGGAFFDIMNVHPYCHPGDPEASLTHRMADLRRLMGKYGDRKKPIWFTEIGWPTAQAKILAKGVLAAALARIDSARHDWRIAVVDEGRGADMLEGLRAEVPGAAVSLVRFGEVPALVKANRPDVIVFPFSGMFERKALAALERDFLPKGGILACLSGVPLYNSSTADDEGNLVADKKNAGFAARPRLKIGMISEHTDKRIPKKVCLANGIVAQRFFTSELLAQDDVFLPLDGWTARTNGFDLAAAGVYRFGGGTRGTIVVSGVMEPFSRVCGEQRQAELLPRALALSLQLGIDRYFVYEFQAVEQDAYDPESHFGIVHKDLSFKPAAEALATFARFRPDGSIPLMGWAPARTPSGICAYQWRCPDSRIAGMLWCPNRAGMRRLKFLTGNVLFHDMYGRPLDAKPDANGRVTVRLGSAPVYYSGAEYTGEQP